METQELILERLDRIEEGIEDIKSRMVNVEFITEKERKLLDESFENEKKGTLVSIEDIENARAKVR